MDHQDASGGFGEDQRSYADPAVWSGKGQPTPSQTAWALFALLAYANASDDKSDLGGVEHAIMKAVGWLVDNQREDGGWDEEPFTGTGFPNDFSLRVSFLFLFPSPEILISIGSTSCTHFTSPSLPWVGMLDDRRG